MTTQLFNPSNPIVKENSNRIKNELRAAIHKQFKKHCTNLLFSDYELYSMYEDCLKKWMEVIPGNVHKESFMMQDLFTV